MRAGLHGGYNVTAVSLLLAILLLLHLVMLTAAIGRSSRREAGYHLQLDAPIKRLISEIVSVLTRSVGNQPLEILVVRFLVEL